MKSTKKSICSILLIFVAAINIACQKDATDAEIEKMCDRLLVLREKPGDKQMKRRCVEDAQKEGVSQRQARCRISAVNTQEYWHRCRTGEPRPAE